MAYIGMAIGFQRRDPTGGSGGAPVTPQTNFGSVPRTWDGTAQAWFAPGSGGAEDLTFDGDLLVFDGDQLTFT